MVPNEELHILTIHFEPPKRGQPLYKRQNVRSQGVLYNGGSTVCFVAGVLVINVSFIGPLCVAVIICVVFVLYLLLEVENEADLCLPF